jgi:PAS domain S-box-containing protein
MSIVDLTGRFVRVNRALCAIVGYTEAELVARDFQSITHSDDLANDVALVTKLIAGEIDQYHLEKRYIHRSGEIRWVLLSGALVRDSNGEPLHLLKQVQDITERKQAETELAGSMAVLDERTRALEAKTREQETFIHSAAHDLRTPLIALQGVANLLTEEYGANLDDTAALYVERIAANAQRMESLLSGLLDYCRIGRGDIRFELVDLNAVVEEAGKRLHREAEMRGVDVCVANTLPVVSGNRLWLIELFTQLFDNAARFTPHDRHSRATVAALHPSGETAQWEIVVSDNGIGIPPRFHEQILGLFRRLPEGKAMHPDGMGTGLALAARIVETHGGAMWLGSAAGGGTAVHITLPIDHQGPVRPARREGDARGMGT